MAHVGSSVRDMSQICFDQYDSFDKNLFLFSPPSRYREHMAGVHGEKNFHLGHAHDQPGVPGVPGVLPHR
jgi:hypothetical protein